MQDEAVPAKPRVILTPDRRLRVFISSTLKELADERIAARQAIVNLRLLPVMFEAGARPHPARDVYQAYIGQSHVFVGIYWQNYGWIGPGMGISGLEDEYNLSASLPRLIYIKTPAPDREPGLEKMLARLQHENTISYKRFASAAELGELLENDLALLLAESYQLATGPVQQIDPLPATNIPCPRNQLLGRDRELQEVCELLSQPETGLVTFTGPGGTGKSRLALETALRMRSQFSDGAFLVPLTPVTDPSRVLGAIAECLELRESAQGRSADEILPKVLRTRQILLLLDNFEHILPAARCVAQLLETCPGLKILVTSRAPLRLRSEKLVLLPPLPLPRPEDAGDFALLSQFACVNLFVQRAQSVRPDFALNPGNASIVAEICRRLDGLPLAIELAAARIRLLAPLELLERLSHRLDVLRGGTRDLPDRQQTLRSAIDWSYDLLEAPAQTLLRHLAVFSGGWSLEAAEAVCNCHPEESATILEELDLLANFNLITPTEGAEGRHRFRMLETIHEYARERLMESGEFDEIRRRHARYVLHFAQEVEPRVRTSERRRWRKVLNQEMDNIRATLRWATQDPESLPIGQELTIRLAYFWALCGYPGEGRKWCERLIAMMDDNTPPAIRAGLLGALGGIALMYSNIPSPMRTLQESLRWARSAAQSQPLANCLLWTGAWALTHNDLSVARSCLEESLALFRLLDDKWSQALALHWLSNTALLRGDTPQSELLDEECMRLARLQGDPWIVSVPLFGVAQLALSRGELDKACSTLLELESVTRAIGDNWDLAWTLSDLAQIGLMRGEFAAAKKYAAEGLGLARDYGNNLVLIFTLLQAAWLMTRPSMQPRDPRERIAAEQRAARLCGATVPLMGDPTLLRRLGTRESYDRLLAQISTAVEADLWDPAFSAGADMALEDALDIAEQQIASL